MKRIKLLTSILAISLIATSCGKGGASSSSSFNSSSSSAESSGESSSSSPRPTPSSSSLPSSSSSITPSSSSIAPKTYTITWKNADGKVLETDFEVLEGTVPTYNGSSPIKDSNAQYDYVWTGWEPAVGPARSDIEYVATYKEEIRKYTIVWKDEDGTVLETDNNIPYGTTPEFNSEEPTKDSTDQYDFAFDTWSPEVTSVTGDAEYVATYKETLRKYTITWKNEDGSVLTSEEVAYGETPEYQGEEPTKESTERYKYTFESWSPNVVSVTGDAEYTATFKEENRTYTVKWVNYDGEVIKTDELEYLATPVYEGETPTRVNDRAIAYTWTGWTPAIVPVESDQVYTATYEGTGFFSFDLIDYDTEEGYSLSSLKGAPWVNTNIQGELNKIKKPSLKDDFYAAINYDDIKNHKSGPFEIGSSRARNALNTIYNNSAITRNGEYLTAVSERLYDGDVDSVSDLINNLDLDSFLNSKNLFFTPSSYLKLTNNGTNYEIVFNDGYIYGPTGLQTALFYSQYDGYTSIRDHAINMINQLGETFRFATDEIDDAITAEINLCTAVYNGYYQYGDSATSYYNVKDLPWPQMKNALLELGFRGTKRIYVKNYCVNAFNYLFNDYAINNPEDVKKGLINRLAFDYRFLMGLTDYRKLNRHMTKAQVFANESSLADYDDQTIVRQLIKIIAPEVFEQTYIELEGDVDIKNTVSNLIIDVLSGYDDLISEIDWLSDTTKKKVLKKLRKMSHESCFSDVYKDFDKIDDSDLDIATLYELFNRYCDTQLNRAYNKAKIDEYAWVWESMPSYTVNAFYTGGYNSFVILNGLARGFVNKDDSIEELYGKLGFVIGHEITHAFDSNGSYYNEYGQYSDLMTSNDRKTFNKKVDKLIDFYDHITLFDNNKAGGQRINSEAIADMGGVKVMLQLAKSIPDFDYDAFFRACAYTWCTQPYNQWEVNSRLKDSHPFAYLRANVTLAQFDEFIETYELGPGDGMYIPEDQRARIW